VPLANSPDFIPRLCEVAARTRAAALVSTVAEEMPFLHGAAEALTAMGLAFWLPTPDAIERCVDKWLFAATLCEARLPCPPTALGSADGVPGPWIVKPRRGRGSRDVFAVDDAGELGWVLRRVPDPIVQTRIDGAEFTVDVLVDRDGTLAGAVPRWRLETRAGISTKGRTFHHEGLIDGVVALVAAVGLQGPANVQGFVTPDDDVVFLEVNPRFSGGLPLSIAAGADLVGEYVRAMLGESMRRELLRYREGVTMTRYFDEVFEG
jgi:carbamoyl-phosphate synthase large subunit